MNTKQVRLLENLVKIPAPSGFENKIAEFIKRELSNYLPAEDIEIDFQHNVIAIIHGNIDKKIMIDAHSDQIGFIVTNVDKEGLISLQYIGGGDISILSARELVILTNNGEVNAVINRKHSHLVANELETFVENMKDVVVDIGIRKRNRVLSIVSIGDPAVYKSSFNHLRENYFSGYGFDDKSGVFILIETIKRIAKSRKRNRPTFIFTFSVQEETGGNKCKALVRRYKPDLFVEVDVTFATDCGTSENIEKEVGLCELNKGIVLYRGVDINKDCFDLLFSVAKTNKIKRQIQASNGGIGYTSDGVTSEEYGIKAAVLGIPLRNMHTPIEIINLNDLNCGIDILTEFLLHKNIKKIL